MKSHRTETDPVGFFGHRGQPTGQAGFTLIELLVVIAIISLLVSILLPSLAKAKNLAKAAMCGSQTRNMALAFLLYREEWDFLPWSAYGVDADADSVGRSGIYAFRASVADELENNFGLDTTIAYTCPADPYEPRRWWKFGVGPPAPRDVWNVSAQMFMADDYCFYTYLDGKDLTLPMYACDSNNVADDAQVATHNNLSSEHALVGCAAYTVPSYDAMAAWHVTDTSYEGFNTAYGDAHVEWTSTRRTTSSTTRPTASTTFGATGLITGGSNRGMTPATPVFALR